MSDLAEALKRAQEARLQYYRSLGKVTVDYWRGLLDIFTGLKVSASGAAAAASPAPATTVGAGATATAPVSGASRGTTGVSLVLEANAGDEAVGLFLVDNKLPRTVSAPVVVSDFVGPNEQVLRPAFTVSPASMTLTPGAQQVVQLAVRITEELEPGAAYRAEATVPGLSDGKIALILRRRAVVAAPAGAPAPAER